MGVQFVYLAITRPLEVLSVRRIVVCEFLSLDGVAEAPNTFLTDWDDDVMDARMSEADNRSGNCRLGTPAH